MWRRFAAARLHLKTARGMPYTRLTLEICVPGN